MDLWRPVGLQEMALVFDSGMRAFPPRLPEQPIFYPVLNREYAVQIARDWNALADPFAGYVLRFAIPDDYGVQFEPRTVGSSVHRELWIPAERLTELNKQIRGPIVAESAYFGGEFRGYVPEDFGLKGRDAYAQIRTMIASLGYSTFDFVMEMALETNGKAVFLHYPFWKAAGASRLDVAPSDLERCLAAMLKAWSMSPRPAALIEDGAWLDHTSKLS